MSTKYILINAVTVANVGRLYPGSVYDDQFDPITRLTSAGAVLAPFTDPIVKAASDVVMAAKVTGLPPEDAQATMLAAYTQSAAAPNLQRVSATFTLAMLTALAATVTTLDVLLGGVLPANATLLGPPSLKDWTALDDATHGTFALVVGTSAGGNQVATTQSVAAGQTGFPKVMTAGAAGFPGAAQGGAQLTVRLTSSVDLNTATGGAVTVTQLYTVLP